MLLAAMASQTASAGEDINWPLEGAHDHKGIDGEALSKLQENSKHQVELCDFPGHRWTC